MKIKRIEFVPGAGVNIMVTKQRTLYDAQGNPVVIDERDEPMAIGINDFAADPRNPTPTDFDLARQKISERLQTLMQQADADLIAENAVLRAQVATERAAKEAALAEVEAVNAERTALQAQLATERDSNRP